MNEINIIDTDESSIWSHESFRLTEDGLVDGHADTVQFNGDMRVDIGVLHIGDKETEYKSGTIKSYVPRVVVKEDDGRVAYDETVDEDTDPEIAIEAVKDRAEYIFQNPSEFDLT